MEMALIDESTLASFIDINFAASSPIVVARRDPSSVTGIVSQTDNNDKWHQQITVTSIALATE